jgi:drug/metabolite transporter (DMT)-like permease
VALFTLFTPLWVTLVNDALCRRFHPRFLGAAVLAVLGAAIVTFHAWGEHLSWVGFGLVQLSNFCFALGQVAYVRWMKRHEGLRDRDVFGLLYAGGVLGALIVSLGTGGWVHFTPTVGQLWVLAYLGLVASGLGFFWWNRGARFVSAGTLAVMNNLKIPLGVACSLLVFGERVDALRLGLGGLLILGALWINRRDESKIE